jgi:hypothetical protein
MCESAQMWLKIDGGVAGGAHGAKFAVGLFHKQRDRRVGVRPCQKAEEKNCAPKRRRFARIAGYRSISHDH